MDQGQYGAWTKAVALSFFLASATAAPAQTETLADGLESSLGQLCKRSQSIFAGKISSLTATNNGVAIGLVGCSNLWGASVAVTNQVLADGSFRTDGESVPTLAQNVVVFASPIPFDPANFQAYRWSYEAHFPEKAATEPVLHAVGGTRGIIALDKTSELTLINSIGHYWEQLRGTARSFDTYASFLTSAQTSTVERVRQDARRDLMLLIRFADKPTLRELRQKGLLNEEGRAYLEKILTWKEKGEPTNVRDMTPKDEDLTAWRQALREGTDSTRLHALTEMLMSERRPWIESKSTLWREDVANLLSNKNPTVRGLVALLLNYVRDDRAIPVLIEMLMSDDVDWRRTAWKELKVKCGAGVSFDPDALPVVRDESVGTVENWFKNHGK